MRLPYLWRDLVVLAGLRCRSADMYPSCPRRMPCPPSGRAARRAGEVATRAGGLPGWTWIMAAQCAGSAESIAQMEAVLRDTENVGVFLRDLAVLAARSVGEDLSCGIMLQPGAAPQAVASSDLMA